MSTSHASTLDVGGMPLERYQRYHEEKAKGGLALTMFGGSSMVSAGFIWGGGQINVSTDEIIPHLQQFSDRIHGHGAAIMCQISHLGRRATSAATNWLPTLAPRAIRETPPPRLPHARWTTTTSAAIIAHYADAAPALQGRRARRRRDRDRRAPHRPVPLPPDQPPHRRIRRLTENRARFGLMVHEAIRSRIGDDFLVGIRFVVDEDTWDSPGNDGIDFDECLRLARLFEAEGHIDFFNAIFGRMDTDLALAEHNMPGMSQPLTPFLKPSEPSNRKPNSRSSTPPASPTSPPPATPSPRACSTWSP